jgi:hypothetical protein
MRRQGDPSFGCTRRSVEEKAMCACKSAWWRGLCAASALGLTALALQVPGGPTRGGMSDTGAAAAGGLPRAPYHDVNRAGKGDRMSITPALRRPARDRRPIRGLPPPYDEREVKERLLIGCEQSGTPWPTKCVTDAGNFGLLRDHA